MQKRDFYYKSADGKTTIHAVEWLKEDVKHYKGIIQIAHGLTEHIMLYEPLAEYFTEKGFIVRGNDHLGHGESVLPNEPRLYLGPKGSWHFAGDDIYTCRMLTEKEYGKLPYIMLGFSLGSYLMRDYLIRYRGTLDACVLVGCLGFGPAESFFGNILANVLAWTVGEKATPKILDFIVNGTANMQIKDGKTPLDWLNKNEKEKEKLMKDKYSCGRITVSLFRELLYAINFTKNKKNVAMMNKDIPIFFISGKEDPVAHGGKTITELVKIFKEVGIKDVHYKLYEGRHRILFEDTGIYALDYIYDWACSKLKTEDDTAHESVNPMLNVAQKSLYTLAKGGNDFANELTGNLFDKKDVKLSDDEKEYVSRFDEVTNKIDDILKKEKNIKIIDIGCGFAVRYMQYKENYIGLDLPAVINETRETYNERNINIKKENLLSIDATNYKKIKEILETCNGKVIVICENIDECIFDFERKLISDNIIKIANEYDGYYIKSEKNIVEVKNLTELKKDIEEKKIRRFRMRHEIIDNTVNIRIEGPIDSIAAGKIFDYVYAMDSDINGRKLVIDLKKINYMLPAGLLALSNIEEKYKDVEVIYK